MADMHLEHAHIIQQTKANMPNDQVLTKVAEVFNCLLYTSDAADER